MVHGLGYLSIWGANVLKPFLSGSGITSDYLLPLPQLDGTVSNPIINGFEPLAVFDSYQMDTSNNPLSSLGKQITAFTPSGGYPISVQSWFNQFRLSPIYQVSQQAFQIASGRQPSLLFQLSKGGIPDNSNSSGIVNNTLVLTSAFNGGFSDGSSMSHVDYSNYYNTKEFLMTPTGQSGINLPDEVSKYSMGWNFGALGPKLLQSLQQLGWTLKTDAVYTQGNGDGGISLDNLGTFKFASRLPVGNFEQRSFQIGTSLLWTSGFWGGFWVLLLYLN